MKQFSLADVNGRCNATNRIFHKHTTLSVMPILASEALPRENKNIQWQNVTPVGIEPGPLITSDSKSNTLLSGLTGHLVVRQRL